MGLAVRIGEESVDEFNACDGTIVCAEEGMLEENGSDGASVEGASCLSSPPSSSACGSYTTSPVRYSCSIQS